MIQKQLDKCEEDKQVNTEFGYEQSKFGYEYGYRFDGQNHNWAILNSYLNMSCSYMGFVIQEKI